MRHLVWNTTEILQCFDALPDEGEHGLFQHFTIERAPLRLDLTIWQYDAEVEIAIWAQSLPLPIIRHRLRRCLGIRPIEEKSGKHIDFFVAVEHADRYDEDATLTHGVRLWIAPQIRIDFIS